MQYENKESLSKTIIDYSEYFLKIPEEFHVKQEYLLDTISKDEFNKAFRDYRNLILEIYKDMSEDPDEYNFTSIDKKGNFKNTKQPVQCIIWLMYALGKAGDVKNRTLMVSSKILNNIFTGNHSCDIKGVNNSIISKGNLLKKLVNFGFEFSITDFDNINSDFSLKININTDIVVAFKAFTLSWYSDESFNCDYTGFNYHVFSVGYNDRLPYQDLYIAAAASETTKTYVKVLTTELAKLGYDYKNIRHHGFNKNVWMYKCCFFYQEDDNIIMNIPPHYTPDYNKQAYHNFIESMPEKYRGRKRCDGCRKECGTRVIGVTDNKKAAYCGAEMHLSNLNKIEDIPYIIELIKVMFKPKEK
ncbi:MAG: hypothetical protein K0S55_2116 [Clostridia bacterium]|nr:hypothetical protein [Clostridia bacterium]